ncbi:MULTISPECIES: hypothetical protein [unclassified Serratia (in: enterobacteria)]|uniref:hypothetical protein n=1 Tax=unclassified Serratia (in: enterobacteria) TaxID=2647522 RepID=UPI0030762518
MKDLDIKYRNGRFESLVIDGEKISPGSIRAFTLHDESSGKFPILDITFIGNSKRTAFVEENPLIEINKGEGEG